MQKRLDILLVRPNIRTYDLHLIDKYTPNRQSSQHSPRHDSQSLTGDCPIYVPWADSLYAREGEAMRLLQGNTSLWMRRGGWPKVTEHEDTLEAKQCVYLLSCDNTVVG